jgi:hypothetical protein
MKLKFVAKSMKSKLWAKIQLARCRAMFFGAGQISFIQMPIPDNSSPVNMELLTTFVPYKYHRMIGTLVNTAAVVAGGVIGLLFRDKLPEKYMTIFFQAIGLFTMYLGISLALEAQQVFYVVLALIIGSLTGEALNLEARMERGSQWLKTRFKFKNERFSEGLLTAFLLYCMGSLTVIGSVTEGLGGGAKILFIKSLMDGVSSIALASAMGVGVVFSAVPLLIYQGGITLISMWLGDIIPPEIITDVSAVGGILLIGLSITILQIKKIRVMNMLPALVVVVVLLLLLPRL